MLRSAQVLLAPVALALVGCGGGDDYADRMADEHAGDRPQASGAATATPAAEIVEETVVYATIEGQPVQGFFARPADAGESGPALLVIQEWWGLNDNIRAMARRLAGEGYRALAVDLYRGEVADDPQRARELMTAAMEQAELLEDNLRQAHAHLQDTRGATTIGTIGWCFGGGWSLRTALLLPDQVDAAVIYYGHVQADREALAALEAPVLGIFGAEDRGIPVESVRAFEQVLEELGKSAEIKIYDGAEHAFANPSGTRYQAEAAEDAWARTLSFFAEHLGKS